MTKRREIHYCHARGCRKACKPEHLMCFAHWNRVPIKIRHAVWQHYRPGQCDDKRPSAEWFKAADAAIGAVAVKEGHPITPKEKECLVAFGFQLVALERGNLL
jgi:hypothetical protein